MTLHMKEAKWGIRNLAQLNAIVEGIKPFRFATFLYIDPSSAIVDAHLLKNMGGSTCACVKNSL